MSGNLRERMREFYGGSTEYLALLEAHDEQFLAAYVNAVLRFIPPQSRALEIGGGNGVAARMLQQAGLKMVCAEISPLFLSKAAEWQTDKLAYAAADGLQLPFPDGEFDAVCSNEYIEHTADAEAALNEMARVTAPGGRVLIAGPNLCSPFIPLRELAHRLRRRDIPYIWTSSKRDALQKIWQNARTIRAKKRAARRNEKPLFLYREPVLEGKAVGGDADSAYISATVDLERWFEQQGWKLLALTAPVSWKGRLMGWLAPRYSPHLCVAAQKPGD